ncbi:MAG: hypothetical protein ABUT20_57260 [Bacteroidota bacterium]
MKKKLFPVAIMVVLMSATGCNLKKKKVSQLWLYTHSSGKNILKDTLLTPASFLNLYPNGTYTRDFGDFESGQWKMDEGKIQLIPAKNRIIVFPYRLNTANEIELLYSGNNRADHFKKVPDSYINYDENDPFSVKNNLWRIHAAHKESDEEIRKRLINHCHFWEAYFAWAMQYELEYIDVRATPTPIKIYGNGFALKPFDYLPERWRSFFYDDDDCKKANHMIKVIFNTGGITWSHTDNQYKMFISAFQQMQQQLKK